MKGLKTVDDPFGLPTLDWEREDITRAKIVFPVISDF